MKRLLITGLLLAAAATAQASFSYVKLNRTVRLQGSDHVVRLNLPLKAGHLYTLQVIPGWGMDVRFLLSRKAIQANVDRGGAGVPEELNFLADQGAGNYRLAIQGSDAGSVRVRLLQGGKP